MKTKLLFGLLVLSIFILVQCSEKKDPVSVSTHPEGWSDQNSANFHGNAITDGSLGQESCQTCHGTDYQGGASGVSCSNSSCHAQYPHPEGWSNSSSNDFHGAFAKTDLTYCQKCHGDNYQGGSSGVSCYKCHDQYPHPGGWLQSGDMKFHGNFLLFDILTLQECQNCHGQDYKGGTSGVACFTCHASYPHPEGFGNGNSQNFHTAYIAEAKWDIVPCRTCHGADYAGQGFGQKNCLQCHRAPGGPEACNTCHGGSDNAAPPVNLLKMTSTSELTIGAHQEHVVAGTWSTFSSGTCQPCHNQPTRYDAPGHIDDTPHAEIIFNSLATDDGRLNTSWDRIKGSCDNVYCHGPFEFKKSDSQYPWAYTDSAMVGSNPRLFWQYPGTNQVLCGTCHGIPPQGHAPVASCTGCHASVVDENLNIVNKFLHINGQIDVFN